MPRPKRVSVVRPIQPGTRIINAAPRTLGTIGLIGLAADGSMWIVSCRHVLERPGSWTGAPAASGEPIFQPKDDDPANVIAATDLSRSVASLDAAAAPIATSLVGIPDILGIGAPGQPTDATVGMPVIKSGSRTGVTQGVVTAVGVDRVEVEPRSGDTGVLTKNGDSGAVWLEESTLSPVAMHIEGNVGGAERSIAVPIGDVLAGLGLSI